MMIASLADHADAIPTIAEWYIDEWEPYYGPGGPGDAEADLASRCCRDVIPAGLVAMDGKQVVGVVALDLDAVTNLAPSIVGLLVRRDRRGQGIAIALIGAAENLAKKLGYSSLYLSTTVLGELLLRRGWSQLGDVRFLNNERGTVYSLEL